MNSIDWHHVNVVIWTAVAGTATGWLIAWWKRRQQ
jgi:hypothetical protein